MTKLATIITSMCLYSIANIMVLDHLKIVY